MGGDLPLCVLIACCAEDEELSRFKDVSRLFVAGFVCVVFSYRGFPYA